MRFLQPRSLTSLMLIGFALVSVPLLLAVFNDAAKVKDLSDKHAALVRTSVEITSYTQQLFQLINLMDRKAQIYQALNDPELLQVYRDNYRNRFLDTINALEKLVTDPERRKHLTAMQTIYARIDSALL